MSTKMLLSTMPRRREPLNSSVHQACKPAVFAASFQPLGGADIKASYQRGKRAKKAILSYSIQNLCGPRGSYSTIFGCLVETLLIASYASRIADELNFLESGPLGSPLQS